MGWHTRRKRKYHYRSKRVNGKVHKVYFGGGQIGEFAGRLHALSQREQEQLRLLWERDRDCINEAVDRFGELDEGCDLLRDAALLAAGFHRPGRHQWRIWRRGCRHIKRSCSNSGN